MRNPKVEQWEDKLNRLLRKVDHTLEDQYGDLLNPHPARPLHGTTPNPQNDGLFRITATFTPGFGSKLGRGYTLQLDIVSLATLDDAKRQMIEQAAIELIRKGLPEAFPDRQLTVRQDGNIWKIVGDLTLVGTSPL